MFYTLSNNAWNAPYFAETQKAAVEALESGSVIYLPKLSFSLSPEERALLTPEILKSGCKNISFNPVNRKLNGIHSPKEFSKSSPDKTIRILTEMMTRFFKSSKNLISTLIPQYQKHLIDGRGSYRPIEIEGRRTSLLKDDTRLHVDAFSATPNSGKRILRVFTNINPKAKGRLWHLGEHFPNVLEQFLPKLKAPFPGERKLLSWLKLTKSYRTLYDHYMLTLHNEMKKSDTYQENVNKTIMDFPSGATWIVMTDQVSHAALRGQFMLEQTFYLPIQGMVKKETSPLFILQQALGKTLT